MLARSSGRGSRSRGCRHLDARPEARGAEYGGADLGRRLVSARAPEVALIVELLLEFSHVVGGDLRQRELWMRALGRSGRSKIRNRHLTGRCSRLTHEASLSVRVRRGAFAAERQGR